MNQWWFEDIDLLTKIRDIGLNDAGIATEVVLPDVIKDLSLTDNAIGVNHQVAK
jgi:hypothetical protein